MSEYRINIIIATHKKYRMPEDDMYLPLHVGAEGKTDENGNPLDLGYVKDNTGENISAWNASFCELTGLYWAWKNLDTDYLGLVHYRRYFGFHKTKDPFDGILTRAEIKPYLGKIKLFVPNKRKYYIESLYSHYAHTHYADQLDTTRDIIAEIYPEYLPSYDKVIKRTYGYMFNMAIMNKELLDDYCSWLFTILFELKNRVKAEDLSVFQGRFYGRVSEIIFNVWLDYKLKVGQIQASEIKEIPYIHMEKTNWFKKGTAFLKAKFFSKKYEGSF
ncbi:MAG: DUF4422 domain-containing protein [Lachnospiraceae bacterium]|nr:DUF4422 domain-containing protein [Lachnospiraceae bacterium]